MTRKLLTIILGIAPIFAQSQQNSSRLRSSLRIDWTDRGINSRDNTQPVVVNTVDPSDRRMILQMPTGVNLTEDWKAKTAANINTFVVHGKEQGYKDVEILTGLDIKTGGYFTDASRLEASQRFMYAVGEAVSAAKKQNGADVVWGCPLS